MLLKLLVLFTASLAHAKIRVGIIDTGISKSSLITPYLCQEPTDFTGEGWQDSHGHGTNIAGLITKGLDTSKFCLVVIKFYSDRMSSPDADATFQKALIYASTQKINVLNVSVSGGSYRYEEMLTFQSMLKAGTVINISSGNKRKLLNKKSCHDFPACNALWLPAINVVGANDLEQANVGEIVKIKMPGYLQCGFGICLSGTSQSTANYTNKVLREMIK